MTDNHNAARSTDSISAAKYHIARQFNQIAPDYDTEAPHVFAQMGHRLVTMLELSPEMRVLDVATGRGAVLAPLCQYVDEPAGIDISRNMLHQTRTTLRHLDNISFLLFCMDSEHLAFRSHTFDLLTCGFAIYFFPRPHQALREMHRVLKPSGQLGLSTWQAEEDPHWRWLYQRLAHLADIPSSDEAFATRRGLRQLLQENNFHHIQISVVTTTIQYKSPAHWLRWSWTNGFRDLIQRVHHRAPDVLKNEILPRLSRQQGHAKTLDRQISCLMAIAQPQD